MKGRDKIIPSLHLSLGQTVSSQLVNKLAIRCDNYVTEINRIKYSVYLKPKLV